MSHLKAKEELDKLAVCFNDTVNQAIIFAQALSEVEDMQECHGLLIEMGKMLDNHQAKMMEI